MRNVQDKKDAGVATLVAVGIALFAGLVTANASAPAEAPVAPHMSVVTSETSDGVITSNVSGGKLAGK